MVATASVVVSAAAAAASADLKVDVQVLDFSAAAAALWCILMSPKMACYMPLEGAQMDDGFCQNLGKSLASSERILATKCSCVCKLQCQDEPISDSECGMSDAN